jgi:hypothetical protein
MWSDKESREDCLGFSSYVSSLAEVCLEKDIAPLVLGIFGSWGSGKSSLMSMLKDKIDSETPGKRAKTLWFNAWSAEAFRSDNGPDFIAKAIRCWTELTGHKPHLPFSNSGIIERVTERTRTVNPHNLHG